MKKLRITFYILFTLLTHVSGQENLLQSGYVNIIVVLDQKTEPSIITGNPLQDLGIKSHQQINDSTFLYSFYSIGPTVIQLKLGNKYYPFLTLPNHTSRIKQTLQSEEYTLEYEGPFKDVFEEAQKIYELTGETYQKATFKNKIYQDANQYRDDRLQTLQQAINIYQEHFKSPITKTLFKNSLHYLLNSSLFNFERSIRMNNESSGLDSVESLNHVPIRMPDYYTNLVTPYLNTDNSLIGGSYFSYFSQLRDDLGNELPDIRISLKNYKTALYTKLGHILDSNNTLFYEMMVAGAISNQFLNGEALNKNQLVELVDFFEHSAITQYILFQNHEIRTTKKNENAHFLPFEKDENFVVDKILERHAGKTILIDFWATWCGPCIEGFRENQPLKKELESNPNFEIIYITDSSSPQLIWRDYVKELGGIHYYISKEQMKKIYEKYNFSSIPTYLLFNTGGKLQNIWEGHPGIEILLKSIKRTSEIESSGDLVVP